MLRHYLICFAALLPAFNADCSPVTFAFSGTIVFADDHISGNQFESAALGSLVSGTITFDISLSQGLVDGGTPTTFLSRSAFSQSGCVESVLGTCKLDLGLRVPQLVIGYTINTTFGNFFLEEPVGNQSVSSAISLVREMPGFQSSSFVGRDMYSLTHRNLLLDATGDASGSANFTRRRMDRTLALIASRNDNHLFDSFGDFDIPPALGSGTSAYLDFKNLNDLQQCTATAGCGNGVFSPDSVQFQLQLSSLRALPIPGSLPLVAAAAIALVFVRRLSTTRIT